MRRHEGKKLDHIWNVIQLFYDCSRVLELQNEAVGRLSDAYKIDSIDGKIATSKQVWFFKTNKINLTIFYLDFVGNN